MIGHVKSQVKSTNSQTSKFVSNQNSLLQHKCACGGSPGLDGECAEYRAKRLSVQRRTSTPAGLSPVVPPIVYEVLGSPGQPLDAGTRAFMELRFGHNFSNVRVHTDARAAKSARTVNALAYTVGRDVVFGTGQYMPQTSEGKRLLAHELTHVIQQYNSTISGDRSVSSSSVAYEQEADAAAQNVPQNSYFTSNPNALGVRALQRKASSGAEASPGKSETLIKDENLSFLFSVGTALLRASEAIPGIDDKRSVLFRRMGWSLTFLPAIVQQGGGKTPEYVAKVAEIWALELGMFARDQSVGTINALRDAALKLSAEKLQSIDVSTRKAVPEVKKPVETAPSNRENKRGEILEEQINEALAKIKEEDISKLDKVQEVWESIAGSNTQQVVNFTMGEVAEKLEHHLPRVGGVMGKLSKLWLLRHFVTIFFDLMNISDSDRRSARRMMFLDTEQTIEFYRFLVENLPAEGDEKKRQVKLVTKDGSVRFEERGGTITSLKPTDIVVGLTLRDFGALFLTNKEEAIRLADIVGSYVWKNSPGRMGTPTAKEAMRRIDEGLKLIRHGVELASNIYALYNPVWHVMETVISVGDILTTGKP
jgi:Domain of unknown function (DUF4157)